MRKESTSRARLPSPQGAEQKARVRYKQDLAEFLPIADGARLIQERAGLTEDEAREDIVAAIRDRTLAVPWFRMIQGERRECYRGDLPHGFLDNLTPNDIDWETSIARRRSVYSPFTVEIEVSRVGVCHIWASPSGNEKGEGKQAPAPHKSFIGDETKCKNWLIDLMGDDSKPEKSKASYREEAQTKFRVGNKAFGRAWGSAVAESGNTAWSRPGPKS